MYIIRILLLILFPIVGHCVDKSADKTYIATYLGENWQEQSGKLTCRLSHEIPGYGSIEFFQAAGEDENANLLVNYGRGLVHHRAEVRFSNPSWKQNDSNKLKSKLAWKFSFPEDDSRNIVFSSRQARQMLDALANGMQANILHRDQTNLTEKISAVILPVGFTNKYQKYIDCQANLIPLNYNQIQKSSVYFETASVRLDQKSKDLLSYIIEYSKDPYLRRIELAGYTDSIGNFRVNHKLASERVEAVRDYLVAAGVPEDQLKLKVYGEQRAEFNNSTPEGRAKNRRVAIKILR